MRDELVKEVTKNEKITELELEIISLRKERLDMLEARHGTSQAQINIPIQILKDKICNLETDLVLKNQRISELEKVLEWYATEFLYDMESFTTTAPLNVVGEIPNNIQINKNPIMYDRGKKARAVLEGK